MTATRQEQLRQTGNAWIILLVLLALVVGAWQFSAYKTREKQAQLAAQQLAEQQARLAEKQAQERAEAARKENERKELESRLAKERAETDALKTTLGAVDALVTRWNDASKVADSTARVSLPGPVATLQQIQREADALTVPPCLDAGKPLLVSSMKHTVDGFLAFMGNKGELASALAKIDFTAAAEQMTKFKAERAKCPT